MASTRNDAKYYDALNTFSFSVAEQYDGGKNGRSVGFGIAERPNVSGVRICISKSGCKLGDGRKKLTDDDLCGLCGGKIAR